MNSLFRRLGFGILVGAAISGTPLQAWADDTARRLLGALVGGLILQNEQNRQTVKPLPSQTVQAGPQQTAMTPDQRMQVQAALRSMGYYAGVIDGSIGPQSRKAIAAWQAGIGAAQSGYLTEQQMRSLVALAPPTAPEAGGLVAPTLVADSAPIEDAGSFYDFPDGSASFRSDGAALERALMVRQVAINPALIDDTPALDRIIQSLGRAQDTPAELAQAYALYTSGSEFDREQGRDIAAGWIEANMTDAPMRVVRIVTLQLGAYDDVAGAFPLFSDDLVETMSFPANTQVSAPMWLGVTQLPMDRVAAADLAGRLRPTGGYVTVAVRMTLAGFRPGENTPMTADAQIERITVHDRTGSDNARHGPIIAELPVRMATGLDDVAGPRAAGSALESWSRLGAAVSDGRVLLDRFGDTQEMALALLALTHFPAAEAEISVAYFFGARLLQPEQAAGLFRTADYSPQGLYGLDAFTKRDIEADFRDRVLPGLIARAPQVPAEARMRLQVWLGDYDFANGSFTVEHSLASQSDGVSMMLREPRSETPRSIRLDVGQKGDVVITDVAGVAETLAMPEAEARALTQTLADSSGGGRGGQAVFMALDMTLTGSARNTSVRFDPSAGLALSTMGRPGIASILDASVTRAALYADEELTLLIAELPFTKASGPAAPPPPVGDAIPKGYRLTDWHLANFALGKGLTEDRLRTELLASTTVEQASEFDRASVIEALVERVKTTVVEPGYPLYLRARVGLGEHDGTTGFAIQTMETGLFNNETSSDRQSLGYRPLQISFDNPDALRRFSMPVEPAKALVAKADANRAARAFDALVQVSMVRSRNVDEDGAYFGVELRAERILLLSPDDATRVVAVAELASAAGAVAPALLTDPQAVTLALQPERLILTPEVVTLIQLNKATTPPSDATLLRLLRARWQVEADETARLAGNHPETIYVASSPWGRFFPQGTRPLTPEDETRLMPVFARWTTLRLAALPQKFTYEATNNPSAGRDANLAQTPGPQTLAALGVVTPLGADIFDHFDPQTNEQAAALTKDVVLGFAGVHDPDVQQPDDGVAFYLPALPATGQSLYDAAVSLDFDLVSATLQAGSAPDLPVVLMQVVPTEVRWWGQVTAVTPRALIATSPVTATAGPVAAAGAAADKSRAAPAAVDIVGVTLGMPLAKAEEMMAAHMTVQQVMESRGQTLSATQIGVMSRLYVSNDGTDFITVLYGPTDAEPRVFGIARSLFLPLGSLDEAGLAALLEGKYGPATVPGTATGGVWNWAMGPAQPPACATSGEPAWLNWTGQTVINGPALDAAALSPGAVASDKNNLGAVLAVRRMQQIEFGIGVLPNHDLAECGPQVAATLSPQVSAALAGETLPEAMAQVLSLRLYDHKRYMDAMITAAGAFAPRPVVPAIKL